MTRCAIPLLQAVVGIVGTVAIACTPGATTVTREVSVEAAFKNSCDKVCGSNCLACVDAMKVFAQDVEGNDLVDPQCLDVIGLWEKQCDFAFPRELVLLDDIPVDKLVVIVVQFFRGRAVSSADAGAMCTPLPTPPADCSMRTTSDLLLWGRSDPIDLSGEAGLQQVVVRFECRDGCDCQNIGVDDSCPEALRPSACVPSGDGECGRECSTDMDCFQEVRLCDGGVCATHALQCNRSSGRCDPAIDAGSVQRPFCATCQSTRDCSDNLCLGRIGEDGGYCARSCPDHACPIGAKCVPVDEQSRYVLLE